METWLAFSTVWDVSCGARLSVCVCPQCQDETRLRQEDEYEPEHRGEAWSVSPQRRAGLL